MDVIGKSDSRHDSIDVVPVTHGVRQSLEDELPAPSPTMRPSPLWSSGAALPRGESPEAERNPSECRVHRDARPPR